jgi:hypothetical protein
MSNIQEQQNQIISYLIVLWHHKKQALFSIFFFKNAWNLHFTQIIDCKKVCASVEQIEMYGVLIADEIYSWIWICSTHSLSCCLKENNLNMRIVLNQIWHFCKLWQLPAILRWHFFLKLKLKAFQACKCTCNIYLNARIRITNRNHSFSEQDDGRNRTWFFSHNFIVKKKLLLAKVICCLCLCF